MAKDGTNRGGARVGAGKRKKPLNEKVVEGKATAEKVLTAPKLEAVKLEAGQFQIDDFTKLSQRDGTVLQAEQIFNEMYEWLAILGCSSFVNRQLVEQYALSYARCIHCDRMISETGYTSQHPTTGNAIASPYVSMAQAYLKEANQLYQQIFQVIKENCSGEYGTPPGEDMMEKLLSKK